MATTVEMCPADTAQLLRDAGWRGLVTARDEEPIYWNPPGGGDAQHWRDARAQIVEFYKTGRQALLIKPRWKTSEFWMGLSGVFVAAPTSILGGMGALDFLGPDASKAITALANVATFAMPAAYMLTRFIAKQLAASEGKELPDAQPAALPAAAKNRTPPDSPA